MRLARTVATALAALAFAPAAVRPAGAAGTAELAFAGTMTFDCYGCGDSHGTAELTFAGGAGTRIDSGAVHADFTDHEGTGSDCIIFGTAQGTMTGALNVNFTFQRVGAIAVISTSGDVAGSGLATFAITAPIGLPCGQYALTAHIDGVIVGTSGTGLAVSPECADGIDNDLDGRTDYPSDPGCTDPGDTSESTDAQAGCTAGAVCVQAVPGAPYQTFDVRDESGPGAVHRVSGRIDTYRFPLPTGGTTTLPCVVLAADAQAPNPCAQAGGTYVSTTATLVDRNVAEPAPGNVVRSVRICSATLTATVLGFGVRDVPTYTVC